MISVSSRWTGAQCGRRRLMGTSDLDLPATVARSANGSRRAVPEDRGGSISCALVCSHGTAHLQHRTVWNQADSFRTESCAVRAVEKCRSGAGTRGLGIEGRGYAAITFGMDAASGQVQCLQGGSISMSRNGGLAMGQRCFDLSGSLHQPQIVLAMGELPSMMPHMPAAQALRWPFPNSYTLAAARSPCSLTAHSTQHDYDYDYDYDYTVRLQAPTASPRT
jgi:hypothetical protein